MARQIREQQLNMRERPRKAALARTLRRGPTGVETVRRGDGQQADVAAVLRHQTYGLDRFRRDRSSISHYHLTVRSGSAQPVAAVDDRLGNLRRHLPLDLLDRTGREPQID